MRRSALFRFCCLPVIALTILSLVAPPIVQARERQITCESANYRYTYCRVYTGGSARLVHKLSDRPCIEGNTWGYDSRGIWVDKGCRATFVVDEQSYRGWDRSRSRDYDDRYPNRSRDFDDRYPNRSSSHADDDNSLGTALGVAAGAALLGALLAGAGGGDAAKDTNTTYDQRHRPAIPQWAIGTFRGYDPLSNSEVELTIMPSGDAYALENGRRLNGFFDGRTLSVANASYQVEASRNGLITTPQGDWRNQIHYFRVR